MKNLSGLSLEEVTARQKSGQGSSVAEPITKSKSKIIKENQIDVDDMTTNELIEFIQNNPSVLKRPIIMDEKRFQVGFNIEEMRAFIPRDLRRLMDCNHPCPQFDQSQLKVKQ